MAIFFNGKDITSVNYGEKAVTAIYKGARLVWEAIRSCFGKGYWIDEHSWNNTDTWKNNI